MQSLIFTTTTAISLLSSFVAAATSPTPSNPADQIRWQDELAFIGCFSKTDVGNLFKSEDTGQTAPTRGVCRDVCNKLKTTYTAISADSCWCGSELPSADSSDYMYCDTPCTGYPLDACGSKNYFYIYGTQMSLRDSRKWDWTERPLHTGTLSATSSATQTQTAIKQSSTVVITESATQPTPSSTPKGDSGMGKAGAAAGAVVGVVLAIAIGVGAFLYFRKQKRRRVEEEYRRSVAVREYAKKPEADMRLDPVMMLHRRASDGSIADNQDYSRRILKVTNPDG